VLSACETGLQDIARFPDEAIGLAGAFLHAGAAGAVATLWPVDDAAAALLCARLYQGLFEEGRAPAAALRVAQLWLRDASRAELVEYVTRRVRDDRMAIEATAGLLASLRKRFPEEGAPYRAPCHWCGWILVGA
jgi:CHAT domain-containing protein